MDWGSALAAENDYEAAIGHYRVVAQEFSDTPTAERARDVEAETYVTWGSELRDSGDYEGAVEKFAVVSTDFSDTTSAETAREEEASTYVAWGMELVADGNYRDGIEMYRTVTDELADTAGASEAEQSIDELMSTALDGLNPRGGCTAREILDGFIDAMLRVRQARANLAAALYNCGQQRFDASLFGGAASEFRRLLADYPNHELAPDAREALVDARVADYESGPHGDFGERPARFGSAPAGTVELVIVNDAPVRFEVLVSGPDSKSVVLEACPSCVAYAEGEDPAFCPDKGPETTLTLVPGTYTIAVISPEDPPNAVSLSTWDLTTGSEYDFCIIRFQE